MREFVFKNHDAPLTESSILATNSSYSAVRTSQERIARRRRVKKTSHKQYSLRSKDFCFTG
ncbi:MAG TPA: hypothetical protein VEC36_10490 [Patescibacteria group bacterium]|nr:hypothetical protein [Patescibacteria group bacterium]